MGSVVAVAILAASPITQALPAGSVGAAAGIAGFDSAQATGRQAAWAVGLRAEALLLELGRLRVRAEVATLHYSAAGATEAIAVDTGYHAAMLMGSVGLRAGALEPYLAAGPVAWWITSELRVDKAEEAFSESELGLGALAGVRAARGALLPRVEAGVAARRGRTALFAGVGLSWAWASP